MKKIFIILVMAALLLIPAALAEENAADSSDLTGAWYAEVNGLPIQMGLAEDGTYTLMFPGIETLEGTWEEQEGYICMDGVLPPEITILGDQLKWTGSPIYFSREEAETYVPAKPKTEIPKSFYEGYWQCAYVDVGGTAVPALVVQDETDLYIEGSSAILGGPSLGDTLVRMTYENGAFSCENDGTAVKIELQEDEFLRLTVSGETGTQIRYLLPAYSAMLDNEETGTVPAT